MSNLFKNPLPGVPNIESPFFDYIFSSMDISDEYMRIATELRDKGYTIFDFPDSDFDRISDNIKLSLNDRYDWQKWSQSGYERADGLRIQDAWKFNSDVKRIATNAEILNLLSLLYGRQAWPFQTLNFPVGTQQHFHTDSVHFSSVPERFMCGVWVAFEDVSEDSGPLVYYPGSHQWPVYTNEHIGKAAAGASPLPNQGAYEPMWEELVRVKKVEPVRFLPKKGQALVWTANLLHGGDRHNDKNMTRWSQVTHYYFEDCAYYTPIMSDPFYGNIQFKNITNICTGEVVENRYIGKKVPDSFIKASMTPNLPDDFNPRLYLAANPDVARARMDAASHYLKYGWREGRSLKPT